MWVKKEEKNNGFDRNVILVLRLDFKIFWRAATADSEKWLLSEIGASIERMCKMKNAPFTSMFVERMEVWNPIKNSKLSQAHFLTLLSRKRQENWFLACVCVCVCVSVCAKFCQWISYERVDRFRWKLRCMLQFASNREPFLTSTIGPLLPPNIGRGVTFALLWTLISQQP